jgi:hypothetical protein
MIHFEFGGSFTKQKRKNFSMEWTLYAKLYCNHEKQTNKQTNKQKWHARKNKRLGLVIVKIVVVDLIKISMTGTMTDVVLFTFK